MSDLVDRIGTGVFASLLFMVRHRKLVVASLVLLVVALFSLKAVHLLAHIGLDTLGYLVVILPIIFGISVEVVPKSLRENPYYRAAMVPFGVALSALIWVQMSRSTKAAGDDKKTAIITTAAETAARVNATMRASMYTALQDYNRENPQNQITSEQFTEFTKDLSGKLSAGAQGKFANITNPMLSDMARVAFVNLRDVMDDWQADYHNEYMVTLDSPCYGSANKGTACSDARALWARRERELNTRWQQKTKPLMIQANECRIEILNRLLPERQGNAQDIANKALYEKMLAGDNEISLDNLHTAAHYLGDLWKRLP